MTGMLSLANGQVFKGILNGPEKEVHGEVVFFTGMTGYEEVLTDPSYKGQIIVFSYPLIGQYGVQLQHTESAKIQPAGIIVSNLYKGPVEKGAVSLGAFAEQHQVPILSGIDTRSVIQAVREDGTMPAMIVPGLEPVSTDQPLSNEFFLENISEKQFFTSGQDGLHIGLVDFHYKSSILKELLKRDCKVSIIPFDASTQLVESLELDGLLFSNGPGDPAALQKFFPVYQSWAERYPSFGICLGHQVLAAAFGAKTEKLVFGHRGANHPVINLQTRRVSMSSQNHSYVVKAASIAETPFSILYQNVNDGSVEGLIHPTLPITTVQFHPEAAPGPADHLALFDQFLETVQQKKKEKKEKIHA